MLKALLPGKQMQTASIASMLKCQKPTKNNLRQAALSCGARAAIVSLVAPCPYLGNPLAPHPAGECTRSQDYLDEWAASGAPGKRWENTCKRIE